MSTIDIFQSGLPIPVFTFCSKLILSVRMVACVRLTVTSEETGRKKNIVPTLSGTSYSVPITREWSLRQ